MYLNTKKSGPSYVETEIMNSNLKRKQLYLQYVEKFLYGIKNPNTFNCIE